MTHGGETVRDTIREPYIVPILSTSLERSSFDRKYNFKIKRNS